MGLLVRTSWEGWYPSWGPKSGSDEIHWSPQEEGHGHLTNGVFFSNSWGEAMGDTLSPAQDGKAHCTDHVFSHMNAHT